MGEIMENTRIEAQAPVVPEALIERYAGNVPRYTSYPTAPHFHPGITSETYGDWLSALGAKDTLSLYVHIPYCDRLCWFCACHTKQTHKYDPVKTYLGHLAREIEAVGARVNRDAAVTALHLGGGSPTLVAGEDMIALKRRLTDAFSFSPRAEIAVEMDPNDLDEARYDALAEIGMTRASLGVQDFNPVVQRAINRIQTFEQTRGVVEAVRARGVGSVNCDVVYGLPHQTLESLEDTISAVLSLDCDRIALFGYAHVPWMKKHQTMIDEASLPDIGLRFAMMTRAAEMIADAGLVAIGIDHFAKPGDTLARALAAGTLTRNFQGYTDDSATALIGLGASAIGRLPQGHVQNVGATGLYQTTVAEQGLAVMRGIALSADDRLRADVITAIMCDFAFSFDDMIARHGPTAEAVIREAKAWAASNSDRMAIIDGGRFVLAEKARPFARSVAAVFDAYLASGTGRHSIAV